MTETNTQAPAVEEQAAGDQSPAIAPIEITSHGKVFNVADPIGKAQYEAWEAAFSQMQGRQANELGTLRQFKKAHEITGSEAEVLSKAKAKAAEGEVDSALELVLNASKAETVRLRQQMEIDNVNNELWDEYLAKRPELLTRFGRAKVKQISEATLPQIFEPGTNAFQTLDGYWKDFFGAPMQTQQAPAKQDNELPPRTVSGSQKPSAVSPVRPGAPRERPEITEDSPFMSVFSKVAIGAKRS